MTPSTTPPFRRVLITGASSGLGRGLAKYFFERGAQVYAAARRAAALESLRAELLSRPHPDSAALIPTPMDVARTDETRATIARIDDETGGLDLVIANAGVSLESDGRRLDWASVEQIIQVNVMGAAATLSAALVPMVKRNAGHLVAVSSLAGKVPLPSYAAYNASKAFLSAFVESLRMDLSGSGLKITLIHPGFVKSEMTEANAFPMPFLLETEGAVTRMGDAIVRGKKELSFPWPLAIATQTAQMLPVRLVGLAALRLKGNGSSWKDSPFHKKS